MYWSRAVEIWQVAIALGLATGALGIVASRRPLAAWLMMAPLGFATYLAPAWAGAAAGAAAGAVLGASVLWGRTSPVLTAMSTAGHALSWASAFGVGAWVWPDGVVAWGGLVLPCATVLALLPLRLLGAPRWISNPLACTQEPWLAVVHTARLAGDLVPSALIALAGSLAVLSLAERPPSAAAVLVMLAGSAVLVGALSFGTLSLRRAGRRSNEGERRVRVAAVVVDPPRDWLPPSSEGFALDQTIARYAVAMRRAAEARARVILLPELALRVTAESRERSMGAVSEWARQSGAVVVAPFFDASECLNGLHIVDPTGAVVARYEKQHPSPTEPKRRERTPPIAWHIAAPEDVTLSAVICVDLDYADLVSPVRRRGGILLVPSHDWPELEHLHHRTAVWAAVMAGVPVVRATGHGTSAAFDAAGRVLARSSSFEGPVVLCVDIPVVDARGGLGMPRASGRARAGSA
jgi:predicted amidohydrolase